MLKEQVKRILAEQQNKLTVVMGRQYYPVDLVLANGNILLRAFRIIEMEGESVIGITWKEEYSAPRERRDPVFSRFELSEIVSLRCEELGIEFVREPSRL